MTSMATTTTAMTSMAMTTTALLHAEEIAKAYDETARCVAEGVDDPRPSMNVRTVTAYTKAVLLDACLACPLVPQVFVAADCACGRGQDIPKLFHALRMHGGVSRLASLHCLDISEESLDMARAMGARWLPSSPIEYTLGDVTKDGAWAKVRPGSVHVLMCHLALHYWCDTADHVRAFFQAAHRAACPRHGLLLVSFADGRWVVRAARAAMSSGCVDGAGYVVVSRGPMTLRIHESHLQATLPAPLAPFGAPYSFHLQGRLKPCTEYLVHEGAVCSVAAKCGWPCVALSERVDILAARFAGHSAAYATIASLMGFDPRHTGGVGDLYRVVVFARCAEDAVAFQTSVWSRQQHRESPP
jgi:SAM-dependent methyltransferase